MMTSILSAYEHLGLAGWIANKRDGIAMLFSLHTDWRSFGEVPRYSPGAGMLGGNRVLDFFLPARSLGMAVVGLALMIVSVRGKRVGRSNSVALLALIVGVASILFSLLVMLAPQISPTQAYGALLLLFLAGAQTLSSATKIMKWGTLVVATGYFLVVWVAGPLLIALRIEWTSLVTALLGALSVGGIVTHFALRHAGTLRT